MEISKKQINKASALAIAIAKNPVPNETVVCVKMNTMYILLDVIERLNLELEKEFNSRNILRHGLKQTINNIKTNCRKINEFVNNSIHGYERQESFGDMTDYMDQIVRSAILLSEDEDRTRAIALLKNLVFERAQKIKRDPEKYDLAPELVEL